MAIHPAKETLTREEIIDILRRNVKLYKNEPEFVNYIVDLALYLLESLADQEEQPREPSEDVEESRSKLIANIQVEGAGLSPQTEAKEPPQKPPASPKPKPQPAEESKMPRVKVDKGGRTRVYKVFRPDTHTLEQLVCPICGSETAGKRVCPNCGNVL